MLEVLFLARVRLQFHQRRWDLLPASIAELGEACRWSEETGFKEEPSISIDPQWATTLAVHYLLFRCLYEDRKGHPRAVRRLRKEAFNLMDVAAERHSFELARRVGGLQEVSLSMAQGD